MKSESYLTIYNLIKNNKKPIEAIKLLNISKGTLNYHLSRLKSNGIIKKTGYGSWELLKTIDEKQLILLKKQLSKPFKKQSIKNHPILNENKIRGHAFMFKLNTKKLDIRNIKYRLGRKGKYYELLKNGIQTTIKECKVHIWPKKIILYDSKSYLSDSAAKCKIEAIRSFLDKIKYAENLLNEPLTLGKDYKFKVLKAHYAILNDKAAKYFNDKKKIIKVKDEYGTWMVNDKSLKKDEKEIWKNKNPVRNQDIKDTVGYSTFMNQMKSNDWKVTPDFILETMNGIQQNQKTFDKNMMTHIDAIKKLAKGVDELRKEIKKINTK